MACVYLLLSVILLSLIFSMLTFSLFCGFNFVCTAKLTWPVWKHLFIHFEDFLIVDLIESKFGMRLFQLFLVRLWLLLFFYDVWQVSDQILLFFCYFRKSRNWCCFPLMRYVLRGPGFMICIIWNLFSFGRIWRIMI